MHVINSDPIFVVFHTSSLSVGGNNTISIPKIRQPYNFTLFLL